MTHVAKLFLYFGAYNFICHDDGRLPFLSVKHRKNFDHTENSVTGASAIFLLITSLDSFRKKSDLSSIPYDILARFCANVLYSFYEIFGQTIKLILVHPNRNSAKRVKEFIHSHNMRLLILSPVTQSNDHSKFF